MNHKTYLTVPLEELPMAFVVIALENIMIIVIMML